MKKLFYIILLSTLLCGCVEYVEDSEDYSLKYDTAQDYYNPNAAYTYNLLIEKNWHNTDAESFDDLINGAYFTDIDEEKVIADLKNTDCDKVTNNMNKSEDIVITRYGEENAYVYTDKDTNNLIVIKDVDGNYQVHNYLPDVPKRYADIINMLDDTMIFAKAEINYKNNETALLSFANTQLYIMYDDFVTNTIYSPSYGDMDLVSSTLPMQVDLFMTGDSLTKVCVTFLAKENSRFNLDESNVETLKSVPFCGEELAAAADTAINSQQKTGKNLALNWNWYPQAAKRNGYSAGVLVCELE